MHPCTVACALLHRLGCRFGSFRFRRGRGVAFSKGELRECPRSVVAVSVSSEWRLVADDVSFRIENIIVSISSESLSARTPPDLFRQSCTGASALQRTLKKKNIAFSHASGFWAGFVLSYRWIPSELNYSCTGYRMLTWTTTRANHFFMFLHSAYDLYRHRHATKIALLPRGWTCPQLAPSHVTLG